MTFVKNLNGTYTIDTTSLLKTTYPIKAEVYINDVIVSTGVTSSILPYTTSTALANNFYTVKIILYSINSFYTESTCKMIDEQLYCAILNRLAGLDKEEKLKDSSSILYFLLSQGLENTACLCACDDLKIIYKDLNEMINPQTCCTC